MECVYVEEASYIDGYRIRIRFNDGKSGEVNLKDTIFQFDAASSLRDPKEFAKFHLDSWPTLTWDCGFDLAPESLHEKCEQQQPEYALTDKNENR
jgi:hypothetical protein